jgi:AcrR family transcriptional regulator
MTAAARSRLAPEVRREQIVVAAQRLYADRPYDQVSTAELAAEAGVARGLINHYFATKREVFLEAMRRSVTMPEVPLPDLEGRSTPERARATVEWILDAATTYGQAWVNASGAANLHGDSDIQAIVDEADDRAARLVLDAIGLPDETRLRARMRPMAALTKALCREWLQRSTLTRDEAAQLLTSAILLVVEEDRP